MSEGNYQPKTAAELRAELEKIRGQAEQDIRDLNSGRERAPLVRVRRLVRGIERALVVTWWVATLGCVAWTVVGICTRQPWSDIGLWVVICSVWLTVYGLELKWCMRLRRLSRERRDASNGELTCAPTKTNPSIADEK